MRTIAATRSARMSPAGLAAGAVRALVRLSFAGLVAFHVWLLGLHLVDGRAFEPATAVRWGLALLVLAGFRALSRRGLPLFSGRRAVGLWLLVVIIHCSAASDGGAADVLRAAIPESITALAQISVTILVLGAAIAAVSTTSPRRWGGDHPAFPGPALIAGLPAAGFVFRFSPRPPPPA